MVDASDRGSGKAAGRSVTYFGACHALKTYKAETTGILMGTSSPAISALRVKRRLGRVQQKSKKTQPGRVPAATSPEITCRGGAQAESINCLYRIGEACASDFGRKSRAFQHL